jgi:type VI secretion system secreted protein VgrG
MALGNLSAMNPAQDVSLPGVHSDVGGGYLPRARERLLLIEPRRISVPMTRPVELSEEWAAACAEADALRASGLAGEGRIEVKVEPRHQTKLGKGEETEKHYWLMTTLDRPVRGELGLVSLRVMRELGVRHGVPFKSLESRPDLALPEELLPIATQILEQTLAGNTEVRLNADQERLLRSRYIHQSAHWIPSGIFIPHQPAKGNRRNVYPDHPQKGYPE